MDQLRNIYLTRKASLHLVLKAMIIAVVLYQFV
jgi:hypothetical protein